MSDDVQTGTIRTQIPARLDRLPWSRFHWKVIIGGVVEVVFGIKAEGRGLEDIAKPLTAEDTGSRSSP